MMHDREGVWVISSQPTEPKPSVSDQPAPERVIARIELPWRTLARVILTLGVIWLIVKLWSILLLLIISLLLTAALNPAVEWLRRRGMRHSYSVATVLLAVLGVIVIFLLILIPPIIEEAGDFADDLPRLVERTQSILQDRYPSIYERLQNFAEQQSQDSTITENLPIPEILSIGAGIVQGISNTIIVFVMTAYLLLDGARIYRWSVRYLPDSQEAKVRQALPEISGVVSHYVLGQMINSFLFGTFSFVVLSIAGVPQPLFLAVLAAILDAVPIVGVTVATIPAVLLALTVSVPTAIAVLIAYIIYQQIENYVTSPRVFGGALHISPFAILVAIIVGGELLGIVGVIIALPVAAAIPVVERIWIDTAPKPSSVPESTDAGPETA